jgi:hypothetical protein
MRNALLLALLCLATPAFAGKGSVAPDVEGVKGARDARGAKDDDAPLDQREGLPAAAVFQRASPSVFVVWAKESAGASTVSQGSAVALTPELLVTNYHVVRGMKSFEAGRGDQRHAATVTAFDEAHDLALLTVAGLGARPARTRLSAEVAVGEHVYAIGAPRGMELTFSDGLVSAFREEKGGRIVQTTAPISPGSSGGGLFDGNGRLIGITTLTLRDSQNLNFALPMEWVDALRHGPGFDPKAAVTLPPTPTWDLGHRPPRLHCDVDREQVWAVFRHGDEILESKPAKGEIFVQGFDGQLPVATAGVGPWRARVSLVLSNMDRRRGWLWFVPEHREERLFYLFDVDQSIFTLSIFVPFDFHGQPRFRVQTGQCKEAPPAKLVSGPTQPLSATCFGGNGAKCVGEAAAVPEAQSAVRLGLLRRGCELRDRASCEAAAKLARTLGMTGLAAAMEGQANALPAPPSTP